jgi:hypothetical protein
MQKSRDEKYLILLGRLLLLGFSFLLAIVILLLLLRLFFGLLSYMAWTEYIFMAGVLFLPACFFISVFLVYFRRTRRHPSKPVRYFSQTIFVVALIAWLYALGTDALFFFQKRNVDIDQYRSYSLWYLAGSVATIFFIGVIQAFSTEKEKDWMDRSPE